MSIGSLDTRASLQALARTPDGGGGFDESWSEIASVWVQVDATGGSDAVGAERNEARTKYRVTMRRRADVAAGQRIVTSAHTLIVHTVLDDGARARAMTLLCEDAP